jgi:hypothetical protein
VIKVHPESGEAEVASNIDAVVGINVMTSESNSANTKIFLFIFSPPFLSLRLCLEVK